LEFLRNGPIFHHLPVRVISVGGGFAYGFGGKSHHSLEDLAILRSYEDLTLIVPADPAQAASSITATETCSNPVFFRLDKNDHAHLDALNGNFSLGNMNILHTGSDCSIIASGSIAIEADSAVKRLKNNGISATLAIVSSFNPSPFDDLLSLPKPWITVEEHITSGGLGGWVSETATDAGILTKILRLGVTKNSQTGVGSQNWFRKIHGIDSAGITQSVTQFIDSI
jgi:transketolase